MKTHKWEDIRRPRKPVITTVRLALVLLWLVQLLPVSWTRARLALIRYTVRMLARMGRAFALFDSDGQPYLIRYLIRTERKADGTLATGPGHMIALHNIQQADADRWLHNHPWEESEAKILHGAYLECRDRLRDKPSKYNLLDQSLYYRGAGDTNNLDAHVYHRIAHVTPRTPLWTLFRTGEKTKDGWGFLIDGKHVPWREANLSIGDWVQVNEYGWPVDGMTRFRLHCARTVAAMQARRKKAGGTLVLDAGGYQLDIPITVDTSELEPHGSGPGRPNTFYTPGGKPPKGWPER